MILVNFDPNTLTADQQKWWDDWLPKAASAIRDAIEDAEAQREHRFNSDIWTALKNWLLKEFFHKKCAYCETEISSQFYGDAEHYRPKGAVTVNGKRVMVQGIPHPGYYWLAYHWKNLIPSCQACNSSTKRNEFPIEPGQTHVAQYAPEFEDPDELDAREQPLLLHPYDKKHDPAKCLEFGLEGVIVARNGDPRGKATIETLKLDSLALNQARKKAQDQALKNFGIAVANKAVDSYLAEEKKNAYWSAVRFYIEYTLNETKAKFG